MRISNLLHFTENHRFTVYRGFALSALDLKMLSMIYQPMIGAMAISVYTTLYHQIAADRAGYSPLEQQRKLFLALGVDPGENGRKLFIEQTSRLEAVGLLASSRKFAPRSEDYIYEYVLSAPLAPGEFFRNQHLLLLLRDKVGKHLALHLGKELAEPQPEELRDAGGESLSVPFYELFRLNTRVIDHELEQAFCEAAPSRPEAPALNAATHAFHYSDIITRFPRGSRNRSHVEGLKYRQDELARINFISRKYNLTLQETCRLLDEDDIFFEDGSLRFDLLQHKANLFFRQQRKRQDELELGVLRAAEAKPAAVPGPGEEKPVEMAYYLEVPDLFRDQGDIHQYNAFLRNEPYTLVLQKFFPNGRVPDGVLNIFEKIDLQYRLNEEVINVLIHYIHAGRRSWSKASIETVAADMLGKQISTYEQAVQYVREQLEYRSKASASKRAAGTRGARGGKQKPSIPMIRQEQPDTPLTEEELAQIREKAKRLDGNVK